MSLRSFQYQIEVRLDKLEQKLDDIVRVSGQKGKQAGSQFSQGFEQESRAMIGRVVQFMVSSISIAGLSTLANQAVSAYQQAQQSELRLSGAIKASQSAIRERNAVLADGNSTLAEKARVLGINEDKLYKEVSATKSSQGASEGLERQIRRLNNAYTDQTRPLEQAIRAKQAIVDVNDRETRSINEKISALREENDERLRVLKANLGIEGLNDQQESLNIEIKKLQNQKAINSFTAAAPIIAQNLNRVLDDQIDALNIQKDQVELILMQKNQEFDTERQRTEENQRIIESKYRAELRQIETRKRALLDEISVIRSDIENRKIKLDLDTEPIQRRLEELRTTLSSSAPVMIVDENIKKYIESQQQKAVTDEKAITDAYNRLFNSRIGQIIGRDRLTQAISDVVGVGVTDTDQIQQVISRAADISINRSRGTNFGEAVVGITELLRSERAQLGESSGLTEETSDFLEEGFKSLSEDERNAFGSYRNLSGDARQRAKIAGFLSLTRNRTGGFQSALDQNLLISDEREAQQRELLVTTGGNIIDEYNALQKAQMEALKNTNELTKTNEQLTESFFGIGFALAGAGGLISLLGMLNLPFLTKAVGLLTTAIGGGAAAGGAGAAAGAAAGGAAASGGGLAGAIAVLTGPVGWVILGVTALIAAFVLAYYKIDWFRIEVDKQIGKFKDYVGSWKDNWAENIGEIIGFVATLPFKLPFFVGQAIKAIGDLLWNNRDKIWEGLKWGASSTWDFIVNLFSERNMRSLGNNFINFLKGLLRGVAKGIPGAENIINPILDNLPRFAGGGVFRGKGTGTSDSNLAWLSDGEGILSAATVRRLGENAIRLLNAGQNINTDNSQSNSNNNIYYQNFGNSDPEPTPRTLLFAS